MNETIDNELVRQKNNILQLLSAAEELLDSDCWDEAVSDFVSVLAVVSNNKRLWAALNYGYKHDEILQRTASAILRHIGDCNPRRKAYTQLQELVKLCHEMRN